MEIDPSKIDYSKMRPYNEAENDPDRFKKTNDYINKIKRESYGSENSSDSIAPASYENDAGESMDKAEGLGIGKLPDVFNLLSVSIEMLRDRMKKFIGIFLLVIILNIGFNFLLNISAIVLLSIFKNYNVVILLIIAAVLLHYIVILSIGIATIRIINDGNLDISDAIYGSYDRIVPFLITNVIGFFVVAGVYVILYSVGLAYMYLMSYAQLHLSYDGIMIPIFNIINWITGFVLIFLVLPLVLIAQMWATFASYSSVIERMSPMSSLSFSFELMKGMVLSILRKIFSFFLICVCLLAAIFAPSLFVPFFIFISFILMFIALFCISFVASLFQFNIYDSLKMIKINTIPSDHVQKNGPKIKVLAVSGFLSVMLFVLVALSSMKGVIDFKKFGEMMDANGTVSGSDLINIKVNGKDVDLLKANNKENSFENTIAGRDEKRKRDLKEIDIIIIDFRSRNNMIPESKTMAILDDESTIMRAFEWFGGKRLPRDPNSPEYYYGYSSQDGNNFELSARLEDLNDPGCDPNIKNICLYKMKN